MIRRNWFECSDAINTHTNSLFFSLNKVKKVYGKNLRHDILIRDGNLHVDEYEQWNEEHVVCDFTVMFFSAAYTHIGFFTIAGLETFPLLLTPPESYT